MQTVALLILAGVAMTTAHLQPWMASPWGPMPFGNQFQERLGMGGGFPGSPFMGDRSPGSPFPGTNMRRSRQQWERNFRGMNLPQGVNSFPGWNMNGQMNNQLNRAGQIPFGSNFNTANDPWAQYRLLTNAAGSSTGAAGIGGTTLNMLGDPTLNNLGGPNLNTLGGPNMNTLGGPNLNTLGGPNLNTLGGSNLNTFGGSNLNTLGDPNLNTFDVTGSSSGIIGSSTNTALSSAASNPTTGVVSPNYPWNTLANPGAGGLPVNNPNFSGLGIQNQNWNGPSGANWNGMPNGAGLSTMNGGVLNSGFANGQPVRAGVPNSGFVNSFNQVQPFPPNGFVAGK